MILQDQAPPRAAARSLVALERRIPATSVDYMEPFLSMFAAMPPIAVMRTSSLGSRHYGETP